MRLDPSDIHDLRPLISAVVGEVLDRTRDDQLRLGQRIAFTEAEAASLLGVPRHTLRDCRLRGEISGSLVGKRIVYTRDDLLTFLRGRQQ